MKRKEVFGEYEKETGNVIVARFKGMNPADTPAVLVKNHGPFTWGTDADNAVHNAVVLEEVAKMAFVSMNIHINSSIYLGPMMPQQPTMSKFLIEKHYSRKHGPNAYYGQKK
jgi:L-ribulose-5-phosphate 4-epimerase